ncbi:hypothetical protein SNEBB_010987 [Seison nebaliae]|nr:hypothetical protein SNEBB_010987 [Seison nebaliae]
MRIAVLGATGEVGRLIVERLIESDHEVLAIVRNPSSMRTILSSNPKKNLVEIVYLDDVRDVFKLRNIFSGKFDGSLKVVDGIISGLGEYSFTSTNFFYESGRAIIAAQMMCGIRRLILITSWYTSVDVHNPRYNFVEYFLRPVFLGRVLTDMERFEQFLDNHKNDMEDVDFTVVRPPHLVNEQFVENAEYLTGTNGCYCVETEDPLNTIGRLPRSNLAEMRKRNIKEEIILFSQLNSIGNKIML